MGQKWRGRRHTCSSIMWQADSPTHQRCSARRSREPNLATQHLTSAYIINKLAARDGEESDRLNLYLDLARLTTVLRLFKSVVCMAHKNIDQPANNLRRRICDTLNSADEVLKASIVVAKKISSRRKSIQVFQCLFDSMSLQPNCAQIFRIKNLDLPLFSGISFDHGVSSHAFHITCNITISSSSFLNSNRDNHKSFLNCLMHLPSNKQSIERRLCLKGQRGPLRLHVQREENNPASYCWPVSSGQKSKGSLLERRLQWLQQLCTPPDQRLPHH